LTAGVLNNTEFGIKDIKEQRSTVGSRYLVTSDKNKMKIKLENITKVYDGSDTFTPAVDNVSLEIESGEFFFLLGPSGCGKTTLLRLIAGLIELTSGRILFDEKDVSNIPVDKRKAAMVFQGYALWPHMTVSQNVEFGPKMQNYSKAERTRLAYEHLKRVKMKDFIKRKPNQLSGGQQQRVALARALAANVKCLLLDEPLSNLDASLRLHMRDELKSIVKGSATTAIYVTHDQKEALSMADRIAVMNDGKIIQVGRPEELYDYPSTKFVADFLGETNFIKGRIIEQGSPVKVQTSLGIIYVEKRGGIKNDSDVICCIRPERIRLVTGEEDMPPGHVLIPGKIVSNIYLGEMRQYQCMPDKYEGKPWKISTLSGLSEDNIKQGKVYMKIAAKDVIILPGED